MKITYSTSKINSFGGINFADSIIGNAQVLGTIDQMLGSWGVRTQYRYSDLFRSYLLMTLCGGECAEDITEHLRRELDQVKNFDVCSADTLLRMQKELATEKETIVSETNIRHDFNINIAMNRLMVKLLVQTGQLSPEYGEYIYDYDNQFLHENTVFLVMMAICRNLYHFLIELISRKLNFIQPNFRLKKFIFRYMVVPSK